MSLKKYKEMNEKTFWEWMNTCPGDWEVDQNHVDLISIKFNIELEDETEVE